MVSDDVALCAQHGQALEAATSVGGDALRYAARLARGAPASHCEISQDGQTIICY
ncbi:hypothetical protein RSSE_c3450 [Ralstonia solanacearum]|nr:hypothetical protein RSSE_c3450 [Ralstonia solanacearum]